MREMCPVTAISPGKRVEVVKLLGGNTFLTRLEEMGILPGTSLEIVSNGGGPVMLGVGNSRFAVGQGIASRIFVREI